MAEIGVIIVAGGSGRRMGSSLPKQFMLLGNQPILARSINRIREALPKAEIVVVLPEAHLPMWKNLAARFDVAPHKIALGGAERFHSVKNGIDALSDDVKTIAIHDGVRPLASKKLIIKLVLEAEKCNAVIPAIAPPDSYRVVEGDDSSIIDRSKLRIIQTPQVFKAEALRKKQAEEEAASADPEIDALVQARTDAKKAKNFAEADRIRDQLKAMGIEIIDTPQGTKWRKV